MGISGLVGSGATDALDEIVTQALAKRRFQEQLRAQQAQEMLQQAQLANAQARLSQDAQQHQDSLGIQNRQLDESAANRRQRANESGVQDMLRQAALMQPKPVKLTKITTVGPGGKPVAKGVTDEELAAGVQEYREPKDPKTGEDKRQWLLRAGKKVFDSYKPGDEPYDAVAERNAAKSGASDDSTSYTAAKNSQAKAAAEALIQRVSPWTAGMGSLLSNIPATDARDFAASLDTLKSNIAFNELAQMRAASKTGGALGAVSDKETRLLEAALGALDQGQSPAQLKKNLEQIVSSLSNFEAARGLSGTPGNNATATPPKKFTILGVK